MANRAWETWVASGRPWHAYQPQSLTPGGKDRGCAVCGIYKDFHGFIVGGED